MTNEEAIKVITTLLYNQTGVMGNEQRQGVFMAVEALEKQIPMKVINTAEIEEEVGKIGYALCPRCRKFVAGNYCMYCGQKLAYLTIEEERDRLMAMNKGEYLCNPYCPFHYMKGGKDYCKFSDKECDYKGEE